MVVDVGTGDGRYVYRSARLNPHRFYIGIDVQPRGLDKVSERIHRRPERGGLPNALFVHAPVEDLPAELDGTADEIHVHFPWGSLLRAVALGERDAVRGLRRIAAPGAWLEVLLAVDHERDATEMRRLRVPPLSEAHVRSTLMPRYAAAGFDLRETGILDASQWPHVETTWAGRLRHGERRSLLYLIGRAA